MNRFLVEEDIRYGQRVKKFSLKALVNGQWQPLKDELADNGNGLTTIGHRRIICFPTVTATKLRFTVTDAKCEAIIKKIGVYLAPELTADIPTKVRMLKLDADRLASGERMGYGDIEVITE
jgi:alpha-L-fucosidase